MDGPRMPSYRRRSGRDGAIMEDPGPIAVMQMASKAQVHPAVVAGRIRYESGNYRLLSQFVGTGKVRRQFVAES